MPTTRHVIALLAATVVAAAACKSGERPAKAQADGAAFHARRPDPRRRRRPGRQRAQCSSPGQARPGRRRQPVQLDELRRLPRRRRRRMGRAQPGRRPLALRRQRTTKYSPRSSTGDRRECRRMAGSSAPKGCGTLVAYIKAQAVPPVVPTTSWLAGGNATATPAAASPKARRRPRLRLRPRRQPRRRCRRTRCRRSTAAPRVTRSTTRSSGRPSRTSPPSTGARTWRLRSSRR